MFPRVMAELDRPRALRRKFLLRLFGQAGEPTLGHRHLAAMMRRRVVHTVLTTNFDDLIQTAHGSGGPIIRVSKPDEYQLISTAPEYPQVIYVHGRAEDYRDRNLPQEVDHLDQKLVSRLAPLLRDHPVVVVGYRGAELSVMRDLFLDLVDEVYGFRNGVFWCVRAEHSDAPGVLSPFTQELAKGSAATSVQWQSPTLTALCGISRRHGSHA
jgi:SIR2-like domain